MSNLTGIERRGLGLTSLDYQNTKQAPIPENREKLIWRRVGILSDKEETITRTSGAVLGRSVRMPRKDLRYKCTHIRVMCGGIGGRGDMIGPASLCIHDKRRHLLYQR